MTDELDRHTVVAGVDGSACSLHAVRWAAREAARRDAPLLLLHTAFVPSPEPYTPMRLPRSYREAVLEQGSEWLAEAGKAVLEAAPQVAVHSEQRVGLAASHLVRASASAELLVVGSSGLGAVGSLIIGSVAAEIAAHARCPVVVVRGQRLELAPAEGGPVVVGVDGSAQGEAAVRFAFEMAASRDVPLIAVHAVHRSGALLPDDARRQLRDGLVRYPGVEVRELIIQDRPTRGLLTAASDAQLIVVGCRGRGGFTGLTLGSTSHGVLHRATCPVALVRAD